jgi:glyoxylase-like metal-dependent hydrolase (beta-lactamase superfamily II)
MRRSLLLVCVSLAGLLSSSAVRAAPDCRSQAPVPWRAVVPGVWVWLPPEGGDVSAANAGHVVPTSVLISGREALVIDPGPSHAHGERLRRSLACRFGAEVRTIVNTHAHSENVLANSAFAGEVAAGRTEIVASAPTREGMAQRCPDCLASLTQRVGQAGMAGTQIVLPTRTVAQGDVVALGRWRLRVARVEHGHTEGDLVLWSERHRIVWAGGLVYQDRLPELAQGRLDGWLAALDHLQALRPRHVISTTWSSAPARAAAPPALSATRDYLAALRARTLVAMDLGAQPQEIGTVALPAYEGWAGYGARHGFNVLRAWRELEPVWMDRPAPPPSAEDVGR